MSKSRISLRRLFSNTKFLIIFSIVLAFIFWIVVALEYAPIVDNVIKDVPVVIDMKNSVPDKFGLQIFGQKDFKVDVNVRGSRYIVGGDLLSANDFEVTAQTAYVNSAGSHTLQLKVTAKNPDDSFEITGLSTDYIEVFFDKSAEKEVNAEARIITELAKLTDNDYLFDESDLIVPVKTLKISGPETEVEKIEKAYIDIKIDKKLTESITVDAKVSFENGTDESAKYVTVNGDENYTVPVTVPVYKTMTVAPEVEFKNIPSGYIDNPLSYSCYPSKIRVAILQSGNDDTEKFTVGSIDFSEIGSVGSNFTFSTDEINNVKILDNVSKINVYVNSGNVSAKTVKIEDSSVTFTNNDKEKYKYDLSDLSSVTVVGPENDIENITAQNLKVTVDTSVVTDSKKTADVPVTITLIDKENCWIYGEYSLKLSVK